MAHVSYARKAFTADLNAYLKLCEGINTPRSLTCWILASSGEWTQLLKLQLHHDDNNIEHSALNYLVTSALKKHPELPIPGDPKQVALEKFLECEEHMKQVNRSFRELALRGMHSAPPGVSCVLRRARRLISTWLGPLSERDLERIWSYTRFGPGSTSAVSGTDVSSSRKYSALGATPRLSPWMKKLLPAVWWEGAGTLVIPEVWSSQVTTVPKNALTERPICIEPHNNSWLQLGIARRLRQKLRRIGLDLDTQAGINRLLAEYAQRWSLATIDLESASDCVAETLVRYLLPARWVHLLELARSEYVKMPDGTIIRLEKWSSMGNGYTFELESLIFYALSLAVTNCPAHTAVFGDDIIVPQEHADSLITALNFCGFRVNRSKTFLGGTFFESCGTDWLNGVDIRPFYFKSEVKTSEDYIDACFKRANQIRLYANKLCRIGGRHGCDRRFLPAWLAAHSCVSKRWANHRIPAVGATDDSGFISNFDEASPSFDRKWGEFKFRHRRRRALTAPPASNHGRLLSFLKSLRAPVSRFTADRGIWTIGDLLRDPLTSVTCARNGTEILIKHKTTDIDLRGVMGKGATAVGRVKSWPSLGPWV